MSIMDPGPSATLGISPEVLSGIVLLNLLVVLENKLIYYTSPPIRLRGVKLWNWGDCRRRKLEFSG
jgi:presenilin-like A22 family membrane protease